MTYRIGLGAAVLLFSIPSAYAYVYEGGPNIVNMSGSACRPKNFAAEATLHHDGNATTVKSTVASQTLFCPIPRRGTTFYRGTRSGFDPIVPPMSAGAERRVNITSSILWGTDDSSTSRFGCFIFGTRMSDQSQFFGATKYMCGSIFGCPLADVSAAWKGANRIVMAPPSTFNAVVDTVNFGISCTIGGSSIIRYTETSITPN